MQQRPASERDQQQCSPVLDTENIRTAILIAIFTIELNCGEIVKPRRIATGLKGLHQNPGKSTNCKKTSPIAPESTSFGNRSRIRVRSTQKPWQCRHNCLQSWGFWWNCNHVSSYPIGHRIAIDPELSVIPDRGKIDPKITSIDTIKLDCNWIAKLQRIASQLVGSH